MSERKPVAQLPAQQKAILGTAIVALLLVAAAGTAFWYGRQSASNTNTSANSTNTDTTATPGTDEPNTPAKIAGKVVKVLGDSIEINTGSGETTRTVTAVISKATELRKIDYRSIPKNGVGNGVPLKKDEITTGASVVVAADDVSSNKIEASKVSLLIYP